MCLDKEATEVATTEFLREGLYVEPEEVLCVKLSKVRCTTDQGRHEDDGATPDILIRA